MPEGIEVEYYRQTAIRALNRKIELVGTVDQNYLRDGRSLIDIKAVSYTHLTLPTILRV